MNNLNIGLIMLSVFCAGGLFAYGREALRLRRLLLTGRTLCAIVLAKERIDSGSESVVHYIVTYEFVDERGVPVVHENDLNSRVFFDGVSPGDEIEILYEEGNPESSYPKSQVLRDFEVSSWICGGLVTVWVVLGAIVL